MRFFVAETRFAGKSLTDVRNTFTVNNNDACLLCRWKRCLLVDYQWTPSRGSSICCAAVSRY